MEKTRKNTEVIEVEGKEEINDVEENDASAKTKEATEKSAPAYLYQESKDFDEKVKQMGTLERLAHVRLEVNKYLESKSGMNDVEGFNYFELKDFMPIVNNVFLKYRIIGVFGFPDEKQSRLEIKNFDNAEDTIIFTMNRVRVNGHGNPMQAEGAINTYSKRYLYMNALELCDKDIFDAQAFDKSKKDNIKGKPDKSFEPYATSNQKRYINDTIKSLMNGGLNSTKEKVKELMKKEGFSSLSQTLNNNYSYSKAQEITDALSSITSYDKEEKNKIEFSKERASKLNTQKIENSYEGDIVEVPEGEVSLSEENIAEMEF